MCTIYYICIGEHRELGFRTLIMAKGRDNANYNYYVSEQ